jgi:B12-binding domain/radical SAM domain protein of rhizo-twelve system
VRVALVNPPWNYDRSIYFGCREPHLPLELAYAKALLDDAGHEALLVDAHLFGRATREVADEVAAFAPDSTVVTTAPTYLFWRCAPPELRVPRAFLDALGTRGGVRVTVGPHGSSTPETALRKLDADVVVMGECEEVIAALADAGTPAGVAGVCFRDGERFVRNGGPQAARFVDLPALRWPDAWIGRHAHHHHASRHRRRAEPRSKPRAGALPLPSAPDDFRDAYRRRARSCSRDRRPRAGVRYIYFVDEIFLPNQPLLEALVARDVVFGVQTRIDLWKPELIDLLGAAGCVSIEAGVESLSPEGREQLAKRCRLSTEELGERLIRARSKVPFVQANLIAMASDEADAVARWRALMQRHGVWANDPVPLYPYPSSPDYRQLFGAPDDLAWERAHAHYLRQFSHFSDIQDERPLSLEDLEARCR